MTIRLSKKDPERKLRRDCFGGSSSRTPPSRLAMTRDAVATVRRKAPHTKGSKAVIARREETATNLGADEAISLWKQE